MYEITYYSIAKKDIDFAEVQRILNVARPFNASQSITGCLLFHNNQFIQVLEGDREKVEALLAKIRLDKRHSGIYVLAEGEKEERTFSDWTMAFRQMSQEELKEINEALFVNNFLSFASYVSKPTRTIRAFWDRVERLLGE